MAWTAASLMRITLGTDYRITQADHVNIPGIRNVRWDGTRNRLVVAFKDHLSFRSAQSPDQEMFGLYLLPKGRHLLHVPYPASLRHSLKADHPGYFWSNHDDPAGLLTVVDRQGQVVEDKAARKNFLSSYFSDFMVRQAVVDYDRFVRNLSGSPDESGFVRTDHLLPASGKGNG